MFLSDQQNAAVRHGFEGETAWSIIELPAGPQPVPTWAKDLHVDFMDGWGNRPAFTIKGDRNLRSWPDKRFKRDGSRFMAVSPDGRAEVYYQGGDLRLDKVSMWRAADGSLHQRPRHVNGIFCLEDGAWEQVEMLCTRQEAGLAGSHIHITLEDGTPVVLRGPWHGGAPEGFIECTYSNAAEPGFRQQSLWWGKKNRRLGYSRRHNWGTCTGGLFVREAEFILIFACYQPHLELVRVVEGSRSHIEPLKPEWDAPKHAVLARQRAAR